MSRTKKALIAILVPVVLGMVIILWDMAWFASIVRDQAHAAKVGVNIEAAPIAEEVIVVLTGDQGRIRKAFELFQKRKSSYLLISGTGKHTTLTDVVNQQGGTSAKTIHEIWSKILMEGQSSSTIENAIETGKLLSSKNVKRIVLVTSDYHMYRSLRIFHRVLPQYEYIPYPVPSGVGDLSFYAIWRTWLEYWKTLHLRLKLAPLPA